MKFCGMFHDGRVCMITTLGVHERLEMATSTFDWIPRWGISDGARLLSICELHIER